jgi:hypothetical protein
MSTEGSKAFLRGIIFTLVWACLLTTPDWSTNADFYVVFPSRRALIDLFHRLPIQFAPGLYHVLISATPPDLMFFKLPPLTTRRVWAVYALVLGKNGVTSLLYIGSATDSFHGFRARISHYEAKRSSLGSPGRR